MKTPEEWFREFAWVGDRGDIAAIQADARAELLANLAEQETVIDALTKAKAKESERADIAEGELEAVITERDQYRAALEKYADYDNWILAEWCGIEYPPESIAQEALKEAK